MTKFLAICKNTFLQTIRQPVYGVLILTALGMFVLSVPLTGWTMETNYHKSDQLMLENLGLSTLLITGLAIAAFSASSALSREIEQKTVLTVVSKPVGRAVFVAGKFAGVALAVTVAYYICSLGFLMTVRHKVMPAAADPFDWPVIILGLSAMGATLLVALVGNYLFNWTFTSSAVTLGAVLLTVAMGIISIVGKGWVVVPFGQGIRGQLVIGMVLTFLAVLILVAVAIAVSTRLQQVMILLICTAVLVLGWIHPLIFDKWAADVPVLRYVGWLVPDLRLFDPQDPLTEARPISGAYVLLAIAYAGCYIAAVLGVGMAMFQTRPLESRTSSSTLPGLVGLLAGVGQAMAVFAAILGAVLMTAPAMHTPGGILFSLLLLVGGTIGWILWRSFGRGRKWAYWAVLLLAALKAIRGAALLLLPPGAGDWLRIERIDQPILTAAQVAVAGLLVVLLLLPKTRNHFQSNTR
ncbi:MAG: hypothetical protein ACLFV7_05040 [Phycisphaerae bacterium]